MVRIYYRNGGQLDQENAVRAENVTLPGLEGTDPDVPAVRTFDAEGRLVGELRDTAGFTVLIPTHV